MANMFKEPLTRLRNLGRQQNSPPSSQNDASEPIDQSLERELTWWQTFMILISGIIGVTIFATTGQLLRTAGPGGLLTAIAYVGLNAICVMEGLGEMVVLWPVSNAMMEYVRFFVDEDLAVVIGLAYWQAYCWASVIAAMFVAAANFTTYWQDSTFVSSVFYAVGPFVILAINWMGVKYFGWVEGFLGAVKLLFVLAGGLFLLGVEGRDGLAYLNEGFRADRNVASNNKIALAVVIPYLTYGFLGVEMISVAAFEAKDPRVSLRRSARLIAWVITGLFILCGLGAAVNISWTDSALPELALAAHSQRDLPPNSGDKQTTGDNSTSSESFSVLALAAEKAKLGSWPGIWNGFLVVSCVSAGNTALYTASRTLYGLCRGLSRHGDTWLERKFARLGTLHALTRVPAFALVVSAAAFYWLPFLHLSSGYTAASLLEIASSLGSVGCVIVWASQCLAFIRYLRWYERHEDDLKDLILENPDRYSKYNRSNRNTTVRYWSIWSGIQPGPAYLGLLMCTVTVIVLSGATMWTLEGTARKFFVAYIGPIVCTLFWLALKARRWQSKGKLDLGTDLSKNDRRFKQILDHFESLVFLRGSDEHGHRFNRVSTSQVLSERSSNASGQGAPRNNDDGGQSFLQPNQVSGSVVGMGSHTENLNPEAQPYRSSDMSIQPT